MHAIATTNAAIAGLIVVEAHKLLAGMPEHCKVSDVMHPAAAQWKEDFISFKFWPTAISGMIAYHD